MINQFFLSLITGIFVGGIAGYLGSLMLTKRMALVGDALGHVALPGIGLALLFGLNVSLMAFLFLALGILLVWALELKTSLPTEALVGVVFVISLAIGFLIIPGADLETALIGNISQVSIGMTVISVILSSAIFVVINRIYPGLILSNISDDLAKVEGIKTKRYNLLYLLLIAVVVALGIRITGSLLVGALVIIPAATARNMSKNLKQYSFGSIVFGALSCIFGIFLSGITHYPAGVLIILCSGFFFLISLLFKK
jgi:ABC-type Mn2+/Zn2+ transport system permease subunit